MLDLLSPSAQAALISLIEERVAQQLASLRGSEADSPWLTVAEAASYLRTTPAAIYKRIKRGRLTAYRPEGSQILLRRDDLVLPGPQAAEVL
jgi:excisionase family DNA binding protein